MFQKTIPHFQKNLKRFLKVIDCMQQVQLKTWWDLRRRSEPVVIKDQIQYRSQSLLNLARGYFSGIQVSFKLEKFKHFLGRYNKTVVWLTVCQVSNLFGKGKPIMGSV